MGEVRNKQYIISASVPACPKCAGGVNKILVPNGIYYKCNDCNSSFIVIDSGQAENELVCEEVQYERTKRV